MKPTKICKSINCTDCQYYAECMENKIEIEQAKGKFSFGELKISRFLIANSNLKD